MPFVPDTTSTTAAKRSGFVPDEALAPLVDPSLRPEQQAAEREAVGVRSAARRERETFIRQNVQEGVPLDIDSELPAGLRARVSFEPNVNKQVELIERIKTPEDKITRVRKSKDGTNVIVTIDEGGKKRDVLLHPKTPTLSMGDVAGATAPILKGGVTGAAALATGGLSLPATAGILAGTAALSEVASTGASRALAGQSLDPEDIAVRAGVEGGINAVLPLAGAAGKRVGGAIMDRLSATGATETATREAAKDLGLPLMPSMGRDSRALRAIEKKPLFGLGAGKFEEEQQLALRAAKENAIGPSPLSESEVAERVRPLAAQSEETAAKGVRTALTDAERATTVRIQAELDSGLIPTTRSTSEVGDFIRQKIAGKTPDSKSSLLRSGAEQRYGEANRLATAEGITIDPKSVTALAEKLTDADRRALLEFAPGIRKIPQLNALLTKGEPAVPGQATGLMDAFDRPIMGAGTAATPPTPLTVPVARELRSVIYDMERAGLAPGEGGVPGRYLRELYKALDNDIDAAIKGGSPELQQAHKVADDFYKANIQPLQQSDVAKLFLETDAAGRLGGDEVVRRLFSGKGNLDGLRAYREVLGKDSPEWKLLVRQGMQTVMEDAGARTGRVDAAKLLTRLEQLNQTELADELLGATGKAIAADTKLLARAQGVKISEDEVIDALTARPGQAARLLEQAIAREQAYDKTYNTQIQQALRDGTLGPRTLGKADDFVDRIVFKTSADQSEIRQALTQIAAKDPGAAEGIRQNTMRKLLNDARATVPEPGRPTTESLNVAQLTKMVNGYEYANARVAIGPDGNKILKELLDYVAANEKRLAAPGMERIASMSEEGGRLAAATIGHKISLARLATDAALILPRKTLGTAINVSPALREYLATAQLPTLGPKLTRAKALAEKAVPVVRPLTLAAPDILQAREAMLAEKP